MHKLATALSLSLSLIAMPSLAGDWKVLPVRDAGFKPDFTVSALVGSLNPEHAGSDTYVGGEVAFNCLLVEPPVGKIRTKISVGSFDDNGLELTSFELNPRWTFDINKNLSVGIGPGMGYVDAERGGNSQGLWAGQVGVDLDYRIGAINLGLAARWQGTENDTIAPGFKGADNTLITAKIGYNF
jgi:hypothetical protein